MRKNQLSLWIFIGCFMLTKYMHGQSLSFRQLAGEQGLHSFGSYNCTFDQVGFLWVSTNDGLARFNGKDIRYYFRDQYPGLPSDQIGFLFCDRQNRIWVATDKGLAVVDDLGKVTRQSILGPEEEVDVKFTFEGPDGQIFALTAKGAFARPVDQNVWTPQSWINDILAGRAYRDIHLFDTNRLLMTIPSSGILLINLATHTVDEWIPMAHVTCATRYDDHHLLCGGSAGHNLRLVDLEDSIHVSEISFPSTVNYHDPNTYVNYVIRAADQNFYISTVGRGLFSLDSDLKHFVHYTHDPVNPTSIITNSLRYVTADNKGHLAAASLDGISYTDVTHTVVDFIHGIRTDDGDLLDERVISLAQAPDEQLWICLRDHLIRFDPKTRRATHIKIPEHILPASGVLSPFWVEQIDGQMWVSVRGIGILVFSDGGAFRQHIHSSQFPTLDGGPIDHTRIIRRGPDNYVYLGTEHGLFRITTDGVKLDTFPEDPALIPVRNGRIVDIRSESDVLWFSTSPFGGVRRYSFKDKTLKTYEVENGLISRRAYGLASNGDGQMYVGSYHGFSIIRTDDSIINITKGSGLVSPRIESLQTASDGSVWMANEYVLLKFDPVTGKIYRLGAREGLMEVGFSVMAVAKLTSGQLAFGTNGGLVIADPGHLRFAYDPLQVVLSYNDAAGQETPVRPGQVLRFSYLQQQLHFSFGVNDLMIADQTWFRYRISGTDGAQWSSPSLNATLDLSLQPGSYHLEIEANDGNTWYPMKEPVFISILPPWWRQTWFLLLLVMAAVLVIYGIFVFRLNRYKRELQLARDMADLESKALRAQMNPHFIFNSLNAIQECIVTGKVNEAYTYLSKFSRLLRLILEGSDKPAIRLQDEIEILNLYLTLEQLRFKSDMSFSIEIANDLDPEEVYIMPMLLQPHIENAVWHGLRDKTGEKMLQIHFREYRAEYMEVSIEDNGIGRAASAKRKQEQLSGNQHKSMGSRLAMEQLELVRQKYRDASIRIEDLYDHNGQPAGTLVVLLLPLLSQAVPGKK